MKGRVNMNKRSQIAIGASAIKDARLFLSCVLDEDFMFLSALYLTVTSICCDLASLFYYPEQFDAVVT